VRPGPPRFSVIIPTYDRHDYLAEALDSVLGQTVDDWEAIVVDDGSPVCVAVPADPRVRLIRLDQNRGPASARNAGVEAARGEILCFCDDDDRFDTRRLEAIERHVDTAPITICWSRFMDGDAGPWRRRLEGDVGEVILDDATPCLGATAIHRDAFEPFDPRWSAIEDVDWWRRVAQHARVTTVASHRYLIRRHDAARNGNSLGARIAENAEYLRVHEDWFDRHPAARAFRLRRIGLMQASLGDRLAARRSFARSLAARPSSRSAVHLARTFAPR
jgi:glycosyltransferase involved in cell wall biosynthesis